MTIWQVLLATSDNDDAQLQTIEVEGETKSDALLLASERCYGTPFKVSDIFRKVGSHGGVRPGAGQPSKFGEKTKTVRLPESLAEQRDLIVAIPELRRLLDEIEQDCQENPDSPRRYFLVKAVNRIRALGF